MPFICKRCGLAYRLWQGSCAKCGALDSIIADASSPSYASSAKGSSRFSSGFQEVDRVLGGGIMPGSIIALTGEPGIGKSTLMLQLSAKIARSGLLTRYFSGEENLEQVASRAIRLGLHLPNFVATQSFEEVREILTSPTALAVIDSIQTFSAFDVGASQGSVSQIRELGQRFMRLAKERKISILLSVHVTKDGELSGPKTLEHMVDTVLYLEEGELSLRRLYATKNRFGSTSEVAYLEMKEEGLQEISSPSFMMKREKLVIGTACFSKLEGSRIVLGEIQALLGVQTAKDPQTKVIGISSDRVSMIRAVLAKKDIHTQGRDLFLSVVGGVEVDTPEADLAIAQAILSCARKIPNPNTCFSAEICLTGELRPLKRMEQREQEAQRHGLGFSSEFCEPISISQAP